MSNNKDGTSGISRREFVQRSTAVTAGAALGPRAYATGADTLRIGLIGCGGRGTGAARDCLTSSDDVELVAMGDLFGDRVASCQESLRNVALEDPSIGPKLKMNPDTSFTGWDAYQRVLEQDIDVVLIATPPAFRPTHVEAAVKAGKHIFMEKPVAVDPTGIRSVIASSELAEQMGLAIVAGTQRRHDDGYRSTMQLIHDGAIGEVLSAQVYWNQGGLWIKPRESGWSDMEWQLRNWLYFTWLSGDHIVEQHIHNIDVANWAFQETPIRATGVGGRQWRTDPAYGHIFDHFAIDFEYSDGRHVMSMCRQIDGTESNVSEHIVGSKGHSDGHSWLELTNGTRFTTEQPTISPYVQEHANLIASIRSGDVLNEGRQVAESTLTAIMGREAAYTGQVITWDQIMNAEQRLVPTDLAFGEVTVDDIPMPGETMLERVREGA